MLGIRASRRVCASALGAILLLAGAPGLAHAWATAEVDSADAHVRIDAQGQAEVQLMLSLGLRGGWLEGLEIAGLDPDLELLEDPILLAEDGERFEPRFTLRPDGLIRLRFTRRDAPRRGRYRVLCHYRTTLAHRASEPTEDGFVRFWWTLPGWRSGLDGVSITLHTPPGARRPEGRRGALVEERLSEGPEGSVLELRRPHLPRTMPWTVSVEVPADRLDVALGAPPIPAPMAPSAAAPRAASPASAEPSLALWPSALIVLFALLAATKLLLFERSCRELRVLPRPLLAPASPWMRVALIALAATAALRLLAQQLAAPAPSSLEPLALLVCLGLIVLISVERTPRRLRVPGPGRWRPITNAELRGLRWLGLRLGLRAERLLDASAPLGLATLALLMLGLAQLLEAGTFAAPAQIAQIAVGLPAAALGLLAALMLASNRSQLPPCPAEKVQALQRLARELRDVPEGVALSLRVHESIEGRWQDARLEIREAGAPAGLLRHGLAFGASPGSRGMSRGFALVALASRGSEAEAKLERRLGPSRVEGMAELRAWVVPLGQAAAAARWLRAAAPDRSASPDPCPVPRGTSGRPASRSGQPQRLPRKASSRVLLGT
ncbi:MAG: hypothetical protein OEY14_03175 [Myxococcales bacterium]|nr:hypothetical protein [Myxococcales bacterium]